MYPVGIDLDTAGNFYFGDWSAYNVIRKVTVSTGIISTIAGIGSTSVGYNGDNIQATSAAFNTPYDVVLDRSGNLYIADLGNHRIRKVDVVTGLVTTVVGTGTASSTGDGSAATSSTINAPCYCRFDQDGNLYVTELFGNRVRKVVTITTEIPTVAPTVAPTPVPTTMTPSVTPSTAAPSMAPTIHPSQSPHSVSIISTIVGNGAASFSGDNGQATSATTNTPTGIVIDASGNVYFNDFYNYRVRKITLSTGIISTYAGTGTGGFSGDGGIARGADLNGPHGLCADSTGNLTS